MTYAGDVSCKEVWKELNANPKAALVDVRTTREWETIGTPDLSSIGQDLILAEWQMFPTMELNSGFVEQVDAALKASGVSKDDPVYFLCRSGARSKGAAAAMTAAGYNRSYNIISGFEGDPDSSGARGRISGWQHDQLPWKKE